ncbi:MULTISPECIES: DUF2461 domain-containing protein [Dactylosporangium]|uniref:TIGR02453 family protein n=2 Tax=Dactylosporangium TaxID=35753 RepID=A0A9W6NQA4_9ACTN|nr:MULTISPECIES: DUF2461 domain-containing protein [Dactylosporangium]UAB93645.1 DUF2461 domain-containing protein [Dactylosporangium vinaceum]UWZ42027.1 DUF2461 domain-containing protein [Dactylosporangium matsuzakiense]GLL04887.1 TIGR02453 family protein [Dactylosporangium matsuzakiense]
MTFRGWPSEALEFYDGLEADNSKTYWTAHKAIYDDQVRAPMTQLLAELEPEFGPAKIFRPHRDVRFSADKSPYKTHCAASFERGGYIQLSASGLAAGAGAYMMDAPRLARFRTAVAADASGTALAAIVADLEARGWSVTSHEQLKTIPRGFDKDHPRAALLRQKGLIAWHQFPLRPWLGTAKARTHVEQFLRGCRPLQEWLATHA